MPTIYNPLDRKHNFFAKFLVSTTDFNDAKYCWNFNSLGIAISNEAATGPNTVQYSFDGVTVHGDMTVGLASEGIIFDNRYEDKMWFRLAIPGQPVLVRLETWYGP